MKIILTDRAKKQRKKLPKVERKKVDRKLLFLIDSPLAGEKLTGDFEGTRRIRAWPYRIIYLIKENKKEVWVVSIIHRQGAYK